MKAAALALFLALAPQEEPRTRTVRSIDRRIDVALPVSTAERSAAAVVTFPEEALDSVVVSWDETALSIERRRSNLFLKLLKPAEGDIHVVGASGTLYRLYLREARPGEPHDARIRIERPAPIERRETPAIDLVRAMRLAKAPPDIAVRSADQVLLQTGQVEIRLRHVYDSDSHVGYILRLCNKGKEACRVDPSLFSAEGLLLVGASKLLVEGGGSTLLFLVFTK